FEDGVSLLQSGVIGRAARLYLLDHRSMNLFRSLKLIAQLRREVAEADAPMHFPFAVARLIFAFGVAAAEFFQRDGNRHALAVAEYLQRDLLTGLLLSDNHLEFAGVADFLTIDFGDHVTDLQA